MPRKIKLQLTSLLNISFNRHLLILPPHHQHLLAALSVYATTRNLPSLHLPFVHIDAILTLYVLLCSLYNQLELWVLLLCSSFFYLFTALFAIWSSFSSASCYISRSSCYKWVWEWEYLGILRPAKFCIFNRVQLMYVYIHVRMSSFAVVLKPCWSWAYVICICAISPIFREKSVSVPGPILFAAANQVYWDNILICIEIMSVVVKMKW